MELDPAADEARGSTPSMDQLVAAGDSCGWQSVAISSTYLTNIQNAISGSAQLSSAHGVSGGAIAGGDPLAPMALTQYVNPFVGSDWAGRSFGYGGSGGQTYPGATLPFGMAQLVRTPDQHPHGRSTQRLHL